jgi:AhpD family alkylhydroperoxidase
MTKRIDWAKAAPDARRAVVALEGHVRTKSGLDKSLINLVYLRVSQLNGCAYCVDSHSRDLRDSGETPERLALLMVWREAPHFSERERCALAWAEAVTELGPHGVADEVYEAALNELGEVLLVELTLAVATINVWNRFGVPFRRVPGNAHA